jgi:hypothetical protein
MALSRAFRNQMREREGRSEGISAAGFYPACAAILRWVIETPMARRWPGWKGGCLGFSGSQAGQDPTNMCDGISIGLGFAARIDQVGPTLPAQTAPDPCRGEAGPDG